MKKFAKTLCIILCLAMVLSFASAIHRLMLQHFLTSTVVTLRPFALYLPSWRILLLVAVEGIEPSLMVVFMDDCSIYQLSLPYVKPVLFSRTPGERINTI